ncbi:MAG: MSHA biogenesis protein MshE, partial [Aeromicrobium sp.]|nr:MSHA biogenesis protein MshE [Burkholderiales bacterium]
LRAVIAQRLCRLLCTSCKVKHQATPQERAWLTIAGGEEGARIPLQTALGCGQCGGAGFRGRSGVYEMFVMDDATTRATIDGAGAAFLASARTSMRGQTLMDHALALVSSGTTSVAEAMTVVSMAED